MQRFSHVVAFDDAPFARSHRGDVTVIGAVFAGLRLDGVLSGRVRRDGANAARVLASMIAESKFVEHLQLVMLQGIAVAGFNVVDVFALHALTSLPVLVVSKRQPDMDAIRDVLLTRVPGGARKWRILERLGPMERCEGVYVQRVGLTPEQCSSIVRRFAVHGREPEPLRTAHLIASAFTRA
jgi:uncharacterized protein